MHAPIYLLPLIHCITSPQNILKRYRFDLPIGIEHDMSNWEKITTAVSYSVTQTRSKIKKAVRVLPLLIVLIQC